MMNQDIGVSAPTGTDRYGVLQYSTTKTVKGRAELGLRRRLDPRGEVVTTDGLFMMPVKDSDGVTMTYTTKNRFTYKGVNYRPIFIDEIVGRTGDVHHYEVEVQLWLK